MLATLADGVVLQNAEELVQGLLVLTGLVLGRGWVQLEADGLAGFMWNKDWSFGAEGARVVRGGGVGGHGCWEGVS